MIVLDVALAIVGAGALWFVAGFRVVRQYERGVVFRFGKVLDTLRGPGLTRVHPGVDQLRKVNMQIVTMPVPAQDGITRDNVTVRVDAVVYFKVVDPVRAIVDVQDYPSAIGQVAQTSLRRSSARATSTTCSPTVSASTRGRSCSSTARHSAGACTSTASRSRTWRCRSR